MFYTTAKSKLYLWVMNKDEFEVALRKEAIGYNEIVASEDGDWIVKGFI